jgi:hypothetical protein
LTPRGLLARLVFKCVSPITREKFPFSQNRIPVFATRIPVSVPTGIRFQAFEFVDRSALSQADYLVKSVNFPVFLAADGNFRAETGSISTASTTTHSRENGDFLTRHERPAVGGHCRGACCLY